MANNLPVIESDEALTLTTSSEKTVSLVSVSTDGERALTGVDQGGIHVVTDPYTGDYEVTPTQETQTLYTNNKTMTANVKVNPIPSNYGLITWNGSVLTVS